MAHDLYLEIVDGRHRGQRIIIPQQGGSLGSHVNAVMVVDEPGVQRFHCSILHDYNGICISDECNGGMAVNGNRVKKSLMNPGDTIQLGACKLRVQGRSQQPRTAPVEQSAVPLESEVPASLLPETKPEPANRPDSLLWFRHGGLKMGPVSVQALQRLVDARTLTPNDSVCSDGTNWIPLSEVVAAEAPEPFSTVPPQPHQTRTWTRHWKRAAIVAAMLVLGTIIAIHYTYENDHQADSGHESESRDETFAEYFAKHSTGLSAEDSSAISFWMAERGLASKKMRNYPREAEQLRFDCSK